MGREFVKTEINKFHVKYVNHLNDNEDKSLLVFYNGGIDILYNNYLASIRSSQFQILPDGMINHVYHCRIILSIDRKGHYLTGSPSADIYSK